jgi:hypothetical protein
MNSEDVHNIFKGLDVETMERMFARYDIDGSGGIDVLELEKIQNKKYLVNKNINIIKKEGETLFKIHKDLDTLESNLKTLKKISNLQQEKIRLGLDEIDVENYKIYNNEHNKDIFF